MRGGFDPGFGCCSKTKKNTPMIQAPMISRGMIGVGELLMPGDGSIAGNVVRDRRSASAVLRDGMVPPQGRPHDARAAHGEDHGKPERVDGCRGLVFEQGIR